MVDADTLTQQCRVKHYNQMRALVFDPNDIEILYAASVDDRIRKWNVTDCSLVAENTLGGESVHCMAINDAGTQLVYGTLTGNVGYIDTSLASYTTSTSAHSFTVMSIFFTNDAYYASFGQDSLGILWNSGSQVSTYTSTTLDRTIDCHLYVRAVYNSTFRLASCYD